MYQSSGCERVTQVRVERSIMPRLGRRVGAVEGALAAPQQVQSDLQGAEQVDIASQRVGWADGDGRQRQDNGQVYEGLGAVERNLGSNHGIEVFAGHAPVVTCILTGSIFFSIL
jgi:hypothetical protein